MRNRANPPSDAADIHLVEDDFGSHGVAFVETDRAEADRETIIRNFIQGQYTRPLRVVAFNVDERWCRDVSEDIALDVMARAANSDHDLPEATMTFIERHCELKKPPAPSLTSRKPDETRNAAETARRGTLRQQKGFG
jgi:hypothetical protein